MTSPGNGSVSGSPSSTAEVAKEEGAAVASTVKEQVSQTTHVAQQGTQQVASEAKEQLTQLGEQAQRELHRVLEQAQQEVTARASEQTDKVASGLRDLAEELHALAEGRIEDAPRAVGWVDQTAQQATHYASRIEDGGFSGVVDDVSRFARRRPGVFLLGAIVAGFATGRIARGVQKAKAGASDPAPAVSNGSGPALIGNTPVPELADSALGTGVL
jgi:hypothetical protein